MKSIIFAPLSNKTFRTEVTSNKFGYMTEALPLHLGSPYIHVNKKAPDETNASVTRAGVPNSQCKRETLNRNLIVNRPLSKPGNQ